MVGGERRFTMLSRKKERIVSMPMLEEGCIAFMQDHLLIEQLVPNSGFLTSSSFSFSINPKFYFKSHD